MVFPLAVFFVSRLAFADKVAVLPFTSTGNATSVQLEDARVATRAAVSERAHTLPTESEMLTAAMSSKDGVVDTSQEYRAAGRASGSAWTLAGHVDKHGESYRLELEACQVESGRVESLAREIDPARAPAEISEMLALLLRPEGIGTSPIPWERVGTTTPAPEPKPETTVVPTSPPGPPPPPARRYAYAEGKPLAVGIGAGVLAAVSRPKNAHGPSTAALIDGFVGYALDPVPGLEMRLHAAGAVAGPQSFAIDAGARYAIPILPTARVFAGPELSIGAFFPLGGERTPRFLAHGAAFVAVGIGERIQVEASGDLSVAPGGSGTLLFAGGTLRGVIRF